METLCAPALFKRLDTQHRAAVKRFSFRWRRALLSLRGPVVAAPAAPAPAVPMLALMDADPDEDPNGSDAETSGEPEEDGGEVSDVVHGPAALPPLPPELPVTSLAWVEVQMPTGDPVQGLTMAMVRAMAPRKVGIALEKILNRNWQKVLASQDERDRLPWAPHTRHLQEAYYAAHAQDAIVIGTEQARGAARALRRDPAANRLCEPLALPESQLGESRCA